MGSFLIGTGVTLVTFYIALIYGSIAIGLIGFAELVLMLLACLYLLIYCRHITADIRIPLTVAEKGKKVTVQLTVDQTMLFPAAKVRYRVRCRKYICRVCQKFLVERCRTDARNAVHGKACRAFSCGKL